MYNLFVLFRNANTLHIRMTKTINKPSKSNQTKYPVRHLTVKVGPESRNCRESHEEVKGSTTSEQQGALQERSLGLSSALSAVFTTTLMT